MTPPTHPGDAPSRAGLYCRVSHDPSGRRLSVADQEKEGRAFCAQHNLQIAWVVIDNDMSASRHAKKARPGYAIVQEKLSGADPVDVLVAWESSRLQRDLEVYVKVRDLCARYKVQWAYSGRFYDLTRTDDRFTTGLDALLAERYAGETRDKVLRSVRSRIERGVPHGRIAYGYRPVYDPLNGAPIGREVVPEEAAVVAEVFRRVLAGEACYGISQDLNDRGVLSPSQARHKRLGRPVEDGVAWTAEQVRVLPVTAVYAGLRTHEGRVVAEGKWPAIVAVTDYNAAVKLLSDPARRTWSDRSTKHLLTNIAVCGICSAKLRRLKNRNSPNYACPQRFCVAASQAPVDAFVTDFLLRGLRDGTVAGLLADVDDEDQLDAARLEAEQLTARLEAFRTSAEDPNGISPEMLARMEAKYLPLIEEATQRSVPAYAPAAVRDLLHAGPDAGSRWDKMGVPSQRAAVRALLSVTIHKSATKHGSRVFDTERLQVEWLNGRRASGVWASPRLGD